MLGLPQFGVLHQSMVKMDVLSGVGQFFEDRGCIIKSVHDVSINDYYLVVTRLNKAGHIECQVVGGRLLMLFRISRPSYFLRSSLLADPKTKQIELCDPGALSLAFNYIKKHLFKPVWAFKGGIG